MASIFVQLACYHDYELPVTIKNLLDNSSGAHQINIGVHLCFHQKQDIELPTLPNVKYTISQAPENIGIGIGRLLAHNHYSGEDYYFQLDSHSRLMRNWDTYLVDSVKVYQDQGFAKPLITNYPRNYWYNDDNSISEDAGIFVTSISFHEKPEQFKELLVPSQTAMPPVEGSPYSKSVSGGSIFTVGDFIKPNPRIAFFGEEIFIAARAYTNGFDLLVPTQQFMFHLYYNHNRPFEVNKRRFIWTDYPEQFSALDKASLEEIKSMFLDNKIGDEYLGAARTLADFEKYSGLNFKEGTLTTN